MSATVQKTFGHLPYLAWCDECKDGVRNHRIARAQEWAEQHNSDKHAEVAA